MAHLLSPRGIDDECKRRIDDVVSDGDGTRHAVASDAAAIIPGAVGVRGTRAALAQARLGRQKPGSTLGHYCYV